MTDKHPDMLDETEGTDTSLDIAVIGMAGRFPGADNIQEFWDLLKNGIEAITWFRDEELLASGVDPDLINNPNYIKSRCIINDEDKFDAKFFDFFPREVEIMDPQHRIFLETCWIALENAGYNADLYEGLIGLFGGVSLNTYLFSYLASQKGFISSAEGYQLSIGNDKDFLTTRVSYKLNLKGPSVAVQTACSTSLVAVHVACQNLLNYSCDMALAGGVSITIPQKQGYYYQEGMILSKDGHCRAFDEKASGTISGNGAGIVVLKRLQEAIEDGDQIFAVIKGSAFNNDGSQRVGYTAPSVDGQADVIQIAQTVANVHPETISYMETHGTGTELGDPIEISALTQIFRYQTDRNNYCAIGSVKTNIGHLDAAAGVAGLIKTILALKNRQIPASLNFEKANPKIDFEKSPFFVNTKLSGWENGSLPLRAGVSSFGIGGTNTHVVLEEAPPIQPSDPGRPYELIMLSAKSRNALDNYTTQLAAYFKANPDAVLADVAYTLKVGRKPFNHRRVLVCQSAEEAAEVLGNRDPKRILTTSHAKEPSQPGVVFMFSGQGAQYVNMGKELYETETVFRDVLDECFAILKDDHDLDLRPIIYPPTDGIDAAQAKINQTFITQPALFVIEYALARLFISWGIEPQAMVGHSIGEYVAACLSGVFSLSDALRLVVSRGKLMQSLPSGAMLSLPLDEHEVVPLLNDDLSIAAINGKAMTVVSGTLEAVADLETKLQERHIEFRRLHTSHAFHSAMMDPILEDFKKVVEAISLNEPTIPYLSNVTGNWISREQALDSNYFTSHIRKPVRFSDNMAVLLENEGSILLEIGPGTTLVNLARRHPAHSLNRTILSTLHHAQETTSDIAYLQNTLGRLWLAGVSINWTAYYQDERRLRLSLPTYPFEKQRYWIQSKGPKSMGGSMPTDSIQKKTNISEWFYIPSWKQLNLPIQPLRKDDKKAIWLIFKDTTGLAFNFIKKIQPFADQIIMVESSGQFEQKDAHRFSIAMDQPEDYVNLFNTLDKNQLFPDYIVHFWNVTIFSTEEIPFEVEHVPGFKSILFMTKALAKYTLNRRIDLGIVTNHLFNITGFDHYKPGKAMVLGLAKVIPQEFPSIHTRVIDVQLPKGLDQQIGDLAMHIATEFLEKRKEVTIAYRGRQRWVQDYEALSLDMSAMQAGYMKAGGVYFITGGLGRIGLALAEKFAAELKAKLVFTDYFDFPARESWQALLADGNDEGLIARIKRLQEIEKMGSEVLILKADVGVKEEFKQVVDAAVQKFGHIDGVFHAAGVVGTHAFKAIPELQEKDWDDQFHAKVRGAKNIADIIAPLKPDFIILQSSMSAILGGLGFGAYAAANAFLDAIVYEENKKGLTQWIAVNWDGWNFEQIPVDQHTIGAETAQLAILPEEGIQAFERILSYSGINQLVVSTGNLHARIDKWIRLLSLQSIDEESSDAQTIPLHSRPDLAVEYVAPQNELQTEIATIWAKLLGIESIGIYDDFFDLGGNSLMGTQLISQLRESFQVELPLRSLFEDPTISGVSKIIAEDREKAAESGAGQIADMLKNIEQMSDEEAAAMLKKKKDNK